MDGGDIGIDEDGFDLFLFERFDSLTSRVVKLAGLSDTETAGTEDQHFFGPRRRAWGVLCKT